MRSFARNTIRRHMTRLAGLGLVLAYDSGSTRTLDGQVPTHGFELTAEGLMPFYLGRVTIDLGGYLGGSVVWQELPGWPNRHSLGFTAGLSASLTWVAACASECVPCHVGPPCRRRRKESSRPNNDARILNPPRSYGRRSWLRTACRRRRGLNSWDRRPWERVPRRPEKS